MRRMGLMVVDGRHRRGLGAGRGGRGRGPLNPLGSLPLPLPFPLSFPLGGTIGHEPSACRRVEYLVSRADFHTPYVRLVGLYHAGAENHEAFLDIRQVKKFHRTFYRITLINIMIQDKDFYKEEI